MLTLYEYQLGLPDSMCDSAPVRQLVRRPAHRSPRLDSPADLTPWSCTHSELAASPLGPIVHVDGFGGIGDVVAFVGVDPKSRQDQIYWAHFDWSLLQFVDRAPETYVWQEP